MEWNRSISTSAMKASVQVPIRTAQAKFEYTDLFLVLGVPSTLISLETEFFWKRSLNLRNLKALNGLTF